MSKPRLCIYFGPQVINIVEIKGRQLINNIQITQSAISKGELMEERVPEDVKMVTLLKEELTKKKIETKETVVVLSGKDLIIRTFEMPLLPRNELTTALNFEVKKYIPFKIEELISDFQWVLDKSTQKIYVLFVGIKKEILEKYLSILNKLELKIISIEYSAFSILRLFKLARIEEKGIVAIVDVDLIKDDEINFVVAENGFPLFSRDITSIGRLSKETTKSAEERSVVILEKLKREILISLDYYERKFVSKHPNKIFFIINPGYKINLDIFKDAGLETEFVNVNKYTGINIAFSLPFIKAYTGSLSEINLRVKIDLLSLKERAVEKISTSRQKTIFLVTLFRPHLKLIIPCLLICIAVYLFGKFQSSPLKKEFINITGMRPEVSHIQPEATYGELTALLSEYKEKIETIDKFVEKQIYLTEVLDNIARFVPQGMWLENLLFKNQRDKDKIELTLEGMAYLGDSSKEVGLINMFLSKLKETSLFVRYFNEISIISLDRKQIEEDTLTHFVISCRNYKLEY